LLGDLEAGLVVAEEQLGGDLTVGRSVGQLDSGGATPADVDDRRESGRRNTGNAGTFG